MCKQTERTYKFYKLVNLFIVTLKFIGYNYTFLNSKILHDICCYQIFSRSTEFPNGSTFFILVCFGWRFSIAETQGIWVMDNWYYSSYKLEVTIWRWNIYESVEFGCLWSLHTFLLFYKFCNIEKTLLVNWFVTAKWFVSLSILICI